MDESYSVGELAQEAGVSVRTLHHYDAIGLLVPSRRSDAGYREYGPDDVVRLAHIVAYRACGMALPDIGGVLDADGADRGEHLRRQLELLDQRMTDLADKRAVLRRALEAHEMGINLDPAEILEVFGDHDPTQHAQEARERWGETEAYAESTRRAATYTKEDWLAAQDEAEAVLVELAGCLAAGEPTDGDRAAAAAEAHRAQISRWYYDCGYDMQVALAEMYLSDPRFTAYYDDRAPGLAQYVHDAIVANAVARS